MVWRFAILLWSHQSGGLHFQESRKKCLLTMIFVDTAQRLWTWVSKNAMSQNNLWLFKSEQLPRTLQCCFVFDSSSSSDHPITISHKPRHLPEKSHTKPYCLKLLRYWYILRYMEPPRNKTGEYWTISATALLQFQSMDKMEFCSVCVLG